MNQDHRKLRASHDLAGVMADAARMGASPASRPSGRLAGGVDASGTVCLLLSFPTRDARSEFNARYRYTWVITADRACLLTFGDNWQNAPGEYVLFLAPVRTVQQDRLAPKP